MKTIIQMEMETNLSKRWLHIYTKGAYYEDYQMPMLQKNKIEGVLPIEGCEVEGTGRYTYDVSGLISIKALYEKERIKKSDMEGIIQDLMETAEKLREFMLNPDCLVLQPEYIFQKEGKRYFCYLPGYESAMNTSFHELTEYFVQMLDYEDMEGICLAYELHKATLQEHYDLAGIMKEYEIHEQERKRERQEKEQTKEEYGNIFSLTEEEEEYEKTEKCEKKTCGQKKYKIHSTADTVCEEKRWFPVWRKVVRNIPGKRWGQWNDLITETDGQEGRTTL